MKNKRALIALGVILLLTIILLIIYTLNFRAPFLNDPSQVKPSTELSQSKLSQFSNSQKASEEEKLELEKIKKGIANIKNESLKTKETNEGEDCEESEEAKKYEEEFIKKGKAQIADGFVTEVSTSYIKVKFSSASYTWISKVNINSKTSITKLNPGSENTNIFLDEIALNSKVVVQTTGESITEEEVTASSLIKVN